MNNDTIYLTGVTSTGQLLVGGLWRIYRQEGFPLDISLLLLKELNLLPDILELFAEATIHYELPQVRLQAPELFTTKTTQLWMLAIKNQDPFKAAEKILIHKRTHAVSKAHQAQMLLLNKHIKQLATSPPCPPT